MKRILVLILSLVFYTNSLMAINCSVASEEDLANYHDFLEKVGKFIYLSSSFSRDSENTRAMTSFLYSHPHVKKHYRPRFENYNEDIKSLLSATYKNRALFMRESLGSTLFLEKVEQAMFKVDTSLTDGLLNETNRIELEPKEHLTPERIGQIMKERELSGREGESKLDEMVDQWRASQAYNNSQASSTSSSQSHGIQGKGLSNVNLLKGKNINTGSGQSSANQQVGNGHGQPQNNSSSNSNSPLGQAAGTGKSSSIKTLKKKLLNSTNSSTSGFGEQEILNILQRSNTLGVNEKTWFDKNLEPYYSASTKVNRINITDDLLNQRIEVRDVKELVDLILTYVNIYSSRGIRDPGNIYQFGVLLGQELRIIVGSKPPGYRWPNFEFIVDSLYFTSLGYPGQTGHTSIPVTINDYVNIIDNLPKALVETLRGQNGQAIRGNLYK